MTQLTPRQFSETEDLEDWRALFFGAFAYFRTGSFSAGAELTAEIARLADAANHHPDVDLRYGGVTVRLFSHDVFGLTDRDVTLARQISTAARQRGAAAEPTAVQVVQVTVDAMSHPDVIPFWQAVLGYDAVGDEDLVDPHGRNASLWFQQMDQPRPQRNRIHVDVCVPYDVAEARVAAAVAAGGRILRDDEAPVGWLLADPEGNEVDVATVHTRG
jgi:4a-hydroxytetrahydrobiopterin dehydratase